MLKWNAFRTLSSVLCKNTINYELLYSVNDKMVLNLSDKLHHSFNVSASWMRFNSKRR